MHEGKNKKKRFQQAVEVHKQSRLCLHSQLDGEIKLQSLSTLSECSLQHQDQQSWSQGALFAELAGSPRELSK